MSLSDPSYLVFLAAIFLLYFLFSPGAPRRVLLLAASYYFYFKLSGNCIFLLFLMTLVTYYGALALGSSRTSRQQSLLFGLVLTLVLIPLLAFKYLNSILAIQSLAFPIGISFFTFVALGYLIDVYLEVVEPERDFGRVALFLAFFPLVSAGPIERAGRFMSQFDLGTKFSSERTLAALRLIFVGLLMKLFIAEALQKPVDFVFASPGNCLPIERLFGSIFYAFNLYADFAGYSLIAIGSAKLFGLEVRPNFLQPFLSTSVPEFWRNWHISLSFWVRDYIFVPLRTSWRQHPTLGMAGALMLSFAIIGVWHGPKWGYLVFGLMHGSLVVASTFTLARRDAFWRSVHMPPGLLRVQRTIATFILVLFPFVVFRANSLGDAMTIFRGIFSMDLIRELVQGAKNLLFHQGSPLHLSYDWNFADCEKILLLVAGDILARQKFTLERFPVLFQVIIYYLGFAILIYKWISGHVAEPFQYYKF